MSLEVVDDSRHGFQNILQTPGGREAGIHADGRHQEARLTDIVKGSIC